MKNRKISIIVIYKNDEETIRACINSIITQKYTDYELICINNGSTDKSETIVDEFAKDEEKIIRIKLPKESDEQAAINTGISLAEGGYICFISPKKVLYESFPGGIKLELFDVINKNIEVEDGRIYKKELLENTELIERLIESKLSKYTELLKAETEKNKEYIKEELDKIAKNNIETINNKVYETVNRINQTEKIIYEKETEIQNKIENSYNNLIQAREDIKNQIYQDIHNVYDYISAEIDKKGQEINKVYEEVTRCYKYTEKLIQETKKEIYDNLYRDMNAINSRINNIENEADLKYTNLKRIMEVSIRGTENR